LRGIENCLNGQTFQTGDAASVSDEATLGLHAAKASQVLLFDIN
jgi:hypothetical protein